MEKSILSKEALDIIEHYFNLKVNGKFVSCPYFINSKKLRAEIRSLIGKGTPEEIEDEVKIWSQVKGLNLSDMNLEQIESFMRRQGIGIDCSGYVCHILNAELGSRKMKSIGNQLIFRRNDFRSKVKRWLNIREIENIDVEDLTNLNNAISVGLKDVRAGDLLRLYGLGEDDIMHVAIVVETYQLNGEKIIKYTHSGYWYEPNGVRYGEIIVNSDKLEDCIWKDVDNRNHNYIRQEYMEHMEDAGFRRLKVLEKI